MLCKRGGTALGLSFYFEGLAHQFRAAICSTISHLGPHESIPFYTLSWVMVKSGLMAKRINVHFDGVGGKYIIK